MREKNRGKYTQTLANVSGQKNIAYARYSKRCFTQIYRDLYGDAMLVHQHDGQKPTNTSVTEFWYESVKLFLKELINI